MPQIDLQDRLCSRAGRLLRQYPLEHAVGPVTAGNEAGRTGGEPGRGFDVGDAIPQARLDERDGGRLIRRGRGLVLGMLVQKRDEIEIQITLAQRF